MPTRLGTNVDRDKLSLAKAHIFELFSSLQRGSGGGGGAWETSLRARGSSGKPAPRSQLVVRSYKRNETIRGIPLPAAWVLSTLGNKYNY